MSSALFSHFLSQTLEKSKHKTYCLGLNTYWPLPAAKKTTYVLEFLMLTKKWSFGESRGCFVSNCHRIYGGIVLRDYVREKKINKCWSEDRIFHVGEILVLMNVFLMLFFLFFMLLSNFRGLESILTKESLFINYSLDSAFLATKATENIVLITCDMKFWQS